MEIRLNTIKDNKGARHRPKIIGRGIGSGHGKTSCRGGKGQTARSGVSLNGFEGGQTPIYRRLPKRGFVNIFQAKTFELDFYKINRFVQNGLLEENGTCDRNFLLTHDLMPHSTESISFINNGAPKYKVNVAVTRASAKAKQALEAFGCCVTIE